MEHKFSYRLLQPNADPKQAVIEKAGITASFTIGEVEMLQARNAKSKLEAEGQIKLEKAKMANIERHHPIVKKLTGEQLTAAAIYKDAQYELAQAEVVLKSAVSAIAENDAMLAEVAPLAHVRPTTNGKKTGKNKNG